MRPLREKNRKIEAPRSNPASRAPANLVPRGLLRFAFGAVRCARFDDLDSARLGAVRGEKLMKPDAVGCGVAGDRLHPDLLFAPRFKRLIKFVADPGQSRRLFLRKPMMLTEFP